MKYMVKLYEAIHEDSYTQEEAISAINKSVASIKELLLKDSSTLSNEVAIDRERFLLINKAKANIEVFTSDQVLNSIDDEYAAMIKKTSLLMSLIPRRYHGCIGCPCNEYDYPLCDKCKHEKHCSNYDVSYFDYCTISDCESFNKFKFLNMNRINKEMERN